MRRSLLILIALMLLPSFVLAAQPSSQPSAESSAVQKGGVAVTVSIPQPLVAPDGQSHPTTQQVAALDAAIDRVTDKLEPHGLWVNGISPIIALPTNAEPQDIIVRAVNASLVDGKAYRILRVRHMDRLWENATAALLWIGTRPRVLIFFPEGKLGWWSRFYDTQLPRSATQPAGNAP
jgi:hypothetical protein